MRLLFITFTIVTLQILSVLSQLDGEYPDNLYYYDNGEHIERSKREVDADFLKRLHETQSRFRSPFGRALAKYFVKNRHQKPERERRAVKDYNYYRNYPNKQTTYSSNEYRTIPLNRYSPSSRISEYYPSSRQTFRPTNFNSNNRYYTQQNYPNVRSQYSQRTDLQSAASTVNSRFQPRPVFF